MPASTRVSPSERFRAQVDELFASGQELGQILEEVGRLAVKLLLQTALEAEATEFLGRDRYARGERAHEGLRNGYSEITVKTTSGPITLERPKLRGNPEPFASRLLGIGVTRTRALESLVIAGFVRGLSDRDLEATLEEALGEQAALSKSTVSRICQVLVSQFEVWQKRASPSTSSTTCSATPASSGTTRRPRASRSCAAGASRPRARRSSSA
jgi:putative transposase